MDQPISRRQHGFADYTYVPLVAAAPALAGFTAEKTAATLCYVLSSSVLASSLFTRAEWGLVRVIPFKAHLAFDALGAVTTLTAPWLFGFAKNRKARNAFLVIGTINLLAGLLTKPEEMPAQA
ncbi:hypothetical protein [Hymenobacter sp. BRD67]|uniref:hypothetical protein n=1 Tax=Hymenobacter sp. BRD67 TaxID=2675877 RepID=UPI001564A2A5|nr:hypothetical protein [Hymenobacter sp. BRD67]QKG53914.1 hypothetical protein GKZ67_16530 [Hymenobacter sp. BRD67]